MHRHHRLKFTLIFVILIFLTLLVSEGFSPPPVLSNNQEDLEVVRFHVLANSDSPKDQALKNMVRDEVMQYLSDKINTNAEISEVREVLSKEEEQVKLVAQNLLLDKGYNNNKVSTLFKPTNFPTRNYGGQIYPAGEYETFQIIIGEGIGENWWCVIFPPLCLTDLAMIPERKGEVIIESEVINKEEIIIEKKEEEKSKPLEVRFKIVEILKKLFNNF